MTRLGALLAERHVRRIVVHVTRQTATVLNQPAASHQALAILHTHGLRVEFAVRDAQDTLSSFQLDSHVAALHVVENGLEIDHADFVRLPEPNSLDRLAADLLGLDALPSRSVRLFGAHLVSTRQIFHETTLSFCLVNLKPIVPGHVLVCPKRCVPRFEHLDADEVADVWATAQLVGAKIQRHYGASSLTFAIQDGPEAGQTVHHVHIHVMPRRRGDFDPNDQVYAEIEAHERRLRMDSDERTRRSLDDMAREAAVLQALCD